MKFETTVVGATMPLDTSAAPRFSVLGPVRAWRGEVEIDLGAPKQRALLGLLLIRAGQPVSMHEIMELLWPVAPPVSGANVVHGYVSRLRRIVPDGALSRSSAGYRLDLDTEALDLLQFADLVAQADAVRSTDPERAADLMTSAVLLWRGPAAADISSTLRGAQVFAEANNRFAAAVLDAANLATGRDRAARVLPALRAAAAAAPFNEAIHAALMRLLAHNGQVADALEAFHGLRTRLADELGVDPGPEVAATYQEVFLDRSDPPPSAIPAARPMPVRPAQLPLDLSTFSGRAEIRERLTAFLLDEGTGPATATRVAVVLGMGGVGKTSLAVHCAHQVAGRFPDGQLYVNLRGFDPSSAPMSPDEAVRCFLTALGVPDAAMPGDLDARVALYRSVTAERGIIVVLDNARNADQARPLLPGGPRCAAIVTSRDPLMDLIVREGAAPVPLEPMSNGEAEALLTRRLGDRVAADPGAVRIVVKSCGGLPLALALFSARAATHGHLTLRQLAAELGSSRDRLDAFGRLDGAHDLRAVFSWSYQLLGAGAARLFRLLSLHHGQAFGTTAAASLIGNDSRKTAQFLAELRRASLITEAAPALFRMHDLVRAYSGELLRTAEPDETRHAAAGRLLDHYVHSALGAATELNSLRSAATVAPAPPRPGVIVQSHADCQKAVAWFGRELAPLIATVETAAVAGDDRAVWQLAWAMENYLQRHRFWADWVHTQKLALAAALRSGEVCAQARARMSLGNAYSPRALNVPEEARTHLWEAVRLFGDCGDNVRVANTYARLADVSGPEHPDRPKLLRTALAAYERAQQDDLGTLPDAQARAADLAILPVHLHLELGEFAAALPHALRCVELLRDSGDCHGEATAFSNLAEIRAALGDRVGALAAMDESVRLFIEQGDLFMAAQVLETMGRADAAAGHRLSAITRLRRALALYRSLGLSHAEPVQSVIDDLFPRA